MEMSIGGARVAVADNGTLLFCGLPSGKGLHVYLERSPKGTPWLDTWREGGCWMLKLWRLRIEAGA
jgi:hypothetical protein